MVRVYEGWPVEGNFVCPEPAAAGGGVAARPFSDCGDCKFMSHMSCSAAKENFAENAKKGLQFT